MTGAMLPDRRCVIDGAAIRSLEDAYDALARALELPAHFGKNLDAFWDSLTTDLEGPVELIWEQAERSRSALGGELDRILRVLRDVEASRPDFRLVLR